MEIDTKNERLLGPQSAQTIRTALTSANPADVIKSIQTDHGLNHPFSQYVFPFISTRVKRYNIHTKCLEAYVAVLINKVKSDSLSEQQLTDLLQKYIPFIHVPCIQPLLVDLVMRKIPDVDVDTLNTFTTDLKLFETLPVGLKRLIWKHNPTHFKSYIGRIMLDEYRNDNNRRMLHLEMRSTKDEVINRIQHPVIQKLVEWIDTDITLYNQVLSQLRSFLFQTGDMAFGSLRIDLLVGMQDKVRREIYENDPLHELAYNLDQCLREQYMDSNRIRAIKEFFDLGKKEEVNYERGNPLFGDFAMVVGDPFVLSLLSKQLVECLKDLAERKETITKEHLGPVKWLSTVIHLGLSASQLISSQDFRIPKYDKQVITNVYQHLVDFMRSNPVNSKTNNPNEAAFRRYDAGDATDLIAWGYICEYGHSVENTGSAGGNQNEQGQKKPTLGLIVMESMILECLSSGWWSRLSRLCWPLLREDVYEVFRVEESFWWSFINMMNRWIKSHPEKLTLPLLSFLYQTILPAFTLPLSTNSITTTGPVSLQNHYFSSIHKTVISILSGASDSEVLARADLKSDLLNTISNILDQAVSRLDSVEIGRGNRKNICEVIVKSAPNVFNLGRLEGLRKLLES